MINPYLCYALSFLLALLTYSLSWSSLYPDLSFPLVAFLLVTIVLHLSIGFWLLKKRKISARNIWLQENRGAIYITIFIFALWSLDFLYEGGIPLVKILLKQPYNYRVFGIPSLHVFIVTFSSFYTVYLFHLYMSTRQKLFLGLYLINLFAAILIYNRGMFLFNILSSFILFLFMSKTIPRKVLYALPVVLILLSYLFGVLGTLRVSREINRKYDNSLFLSIGQPTRSFEESFIPAEFFWTYIYVSSPLANLQHNVNTYKIPEKNWKRLLAMINNEVIMDFASKRVNGFFGITREVDNRIPGPFNVSTVYSVPYSYLGWTGMIIMALIVLILPGIYSKFLPIESPFFLTGFAILSTMFLFLAFDNTIRFTGLSLQLVYPLLLNFIVNRFGLAKKLFA